MAIHVQVPVDVATFLLNEKRSDIHRIESRLKVGITLIPNPYLETPNYSISRLRQDDMTGEVLQASYKLVEKPAEEKPLTAAQEQQKATRAQAVVQGITPAQPAPMKVEEEKKAQLSIFGKFFGWIKTLGADEQPKAKPVASAPRSQPRRERGERSERSEGGKRRERGERGEGGSARRERGEKPVPAVAAAKPQEPRQQAEREPRPQGEPRQPRPPRPPRAAPVPQPEEKPVLESQIAAPAAEPAEEGSAREGARRRGRRGGRRERERRDNIVPGGEMPTGNGETAVAEQAAAPATAAPVDTAPAKLKPSEYIAYPKGWTPPVTPSEDITVPTTATQQDVAAVVVREITAPVAASSGESLVQIETDQGKLQAVANIPAGYADKPATRRRTRQHEVYVENEPLEQVETQRPQA